MQLLVEVSRRVGRDSWWLENVDITMGYVGAKNLDDFHNKAQFIRISSAGLRESHVHDVTITRESPNYPSRV